MTCAANMCAAGTGELQGAFESNTLSLICCEEKLSQLSCVCMHCNASRIAASTSWSSAVTRRADTQGRDERPGRPDDARLHKAGVQEAVEGVRAAARCMLQCAAVSHVSSSLDLRRRTITAPTCGRPKNVQKVCKARQKGEQVISLQQHVAKYKGGPTGMAYMSMRQRAWFKPAGLLT